MQVLKLIDSHPLKSRLSYEVGFGGADGQVFQHLTDKEKVIKISVVYEHAIPVEKQISNTFQVLEYLKLYKPDAYAHVYEFDIIKNYYRDTISGVQKYIVYYYIMDKCNPLTEDEKKVFHTIVSHEDKLKNKSPVPALHVLDDLSMGLDFDLSKIIKFCQTINCLPIQHLDIHPRNIMKNKLGDFCLIDFDRCELRKEI